VGVDVGSNLVGLAEFSWSSPEMNLTSPNVPSTNLAALEVAQISPVTIDKGFVLMGSTQIVSETILPSTKATKFNLPSPELTQTVPVRSSISPEPFGLNDFSAGLESTLDLAVPEAQLLVNRLTEAQAWYLWWLRDGTRSHELLAAIDCFELQMRRNNEVALPLVCSVELPKLKAALEAGIRDINRETVVQSFVLSVVASLDDGSPEAAAGVPAVLPTASVGAGFITPPDVFVG
jgi:hypothetical protein